jgi:hypothetical protein
VKALTIKQPWATLIALGGKNIETRSWKTNYRGSLLIHAGKTIDKVACKMPEIYKVMEDYQYHTGVIIAKCNLVACQKVIEDSGTYAITDGRLMITDNEYDFGDYTVGRYAWILSNIEVLDKYIPAKGQLSLWEFKGAIG